MTCLNIPRNNLPEVFTTWSFLITPVHAIAKAVFLTFFGMPIVFYSFYKSVCDFGPAHIKKRSLIDIIKQPVPDEVHMTTIERHRGKTNRRRDVWHQIHRPNTIRRKVYRRGFNIASGKQHIVPLRERHCIYTSFYSTHAGHFGSGFINASSEMARVMYFAINVFSPPTIHFLPNPKRPPDGFLTKFILKSATPAIFIAMALAYLTCVCFYVSRRFIRKNARHIAPSTWFKLMCILIKRALPTKCTCPVNLPRFITLITSQSTIATLLTLSGVVDFFAREDPPDEREEHYDADDGGRDWSSGECFVDASDGSNLAESGYGPPEATEFVGPTDSILSSKRKCMFLTIMTISRSTFTVELPSHATVLDLKLAISSRTGTPPADMRIYFQRHHLSDSIMLCSQGVASGSTVTLALAIMVAGLTGANSDSDTSPTPPHDTRIPTALRPRRLMTSFLPLQ